MLLGIVSDTHGQAVRLRTAVSLFERLGVDQIVHCGDVGGIRVFDELVGRRCRFVWGNTDVIEPALIAYLRTAGLPIPAAIPLRIETDGKVILVFHGHEAQFREVLAQGSGDYILHGHTHVARDERVGGIRVINPGALHRAAQYTVATLDTLSDAVAFHDIAR